MKNTMLQLSSALVIAMITLLGCTKEPMQTNEMNATPNLTVSEGPAINMHISAMSIWGVHGPSRHKTCSFMCPYLYDVASVTVLDETGVPVEGVTVVGNFTGSYKLLKVSAVTNTSGIVTIKGKAGKAGDQETFTVTSLAKSGYSWDATSDVIESVTYTIPSN
jgi:hypothetical protein